MALLIVPYGIETDMPGIDHFDTCFLLIVPYGIETDYKAVPNSLYELLIVPYGIETSYPQKW